MRDVEDTCVVPDRTMLVGDARVLHRHLPARERDETGAECGMSLVQWRAPKRLHRAGSYSHREPSDAPKGGSEPPVSTLSRSGAQVVRETVPKRRLAVPGASREMPQPDASHASPGRGPGRRAG